MPKIQIDLPEFRRYILEMNNLVIRIVDHNRNFTQTIQRLGSEGWDDDVYRDAHNMLMSLQGEFNIFIDLLYEQDVYLVDTYGKIYENYKKEDCVLPRVDMPHVTIIPALAMRRNDLVSVLRETIEAFVVETRGYITKIRAEMSGFDTTHRQFARYFRTSRYDELTDALRRPLQNIADTLNAMEEQANAVNDQKEFIWPFA